MKKVKIYIEIGASLGKVFLGKAQEQESSRVLRWLHRSPRAAHIVSETIDKQSLAAKRKIYENCDTAAAWDNVIRRARVSTIQPKRPLLSRPTIRWAAASIVTAALIITATIYHYSDTQRRAALNSIAEIRPEGTKAMLYRADGQAIELTADSEGLALDGLQVGENSIEYSGSAKAEANMMDEVVTPRGCEYSLKLVDGTIAWLNSSSRLRYFTDPNASTRLVYAEGEVYFDVAPDTQHPFVVISGKQRIEVLGTEFNLNTYKSTICTTLIEGSISLGSADMTSKVTLAAGQQALLESTEQQIEVRNVDTEKYTAWRNGTFVFEQATIDEIMESLARWYDFGYDISPKLRSLRFSGQFPRYENLDKIISILLSTGSGIDIKVEGTTIKFT